MQSSVSPGEAEVTVRKKSHNSKQSDWVWVLDNYDSRTTEKSNVESEIRRLQVLKTFSLLDRPMEPCYERFTSLAVRMFQTPMALLSLVDLGRTFLVAHSGFGSTLTERELPRKTSFCAHAILCFHPVLVVTDAAADKRFAETPLVQDWGVRFAACAPLTTPEGYRLGCLTILDHNARPEGLNQGDIEALQNLAASVMDLMLEKRLALQGVGQAGLSFSYDVQRAATQLKESLYHLKDDFDFQAVASDSHQSLLQSACTFYSLLKKRQACLPIYSSQLCVCSFVVLHRYHGGSFTFIRSIQR